MPILRQARHTRSCKTERSVQPAPFGSGRPPATVRGCSLELKTSSDRAIFMSALVVLAHMTIKSYDLVVALTGDGPGGSTQLPSTFMYEFTFTRNQMAVGSASAVMMFMTIAAIMIPYLYSELKEKHR